MEALESYTKQWQSRGLWPLDGKNVHSAERVGSALAGGALLLFAALRPNLIRSLVASILGGALVHRGVSGHCPAYSVLGVDTAHRRLPKPRVGAAPSREEARLDDMLDDSFPASDPPSH